MKNDIALRVAAGLSICLLSSSPLPAETDLRSIMQGLQSDAIMIMEGLLSDDLSRVADGADRIATHPQIPPDQVARVAAELGAGMAAFKQLDTAVHDLSLAVAAAARAGDADQALAGFQQMLSNCLACHTRYKQRVAGVLAGAAEP